MLGVRIPSATPSFVGGLIMKMFKSPSCRKEEESKEECINRKMPELIDEGYEQDQAYAIAESMCSESCEEKVLRIKWER